MNASQAIGGQFSEFSGSDDEQKISKQSSAAQNESSVQEGPSESKTGEQARFLGRSYAPASKVDGVAKVRTGMFLGRECIIEAPSPAKPEKRTVVRFLGREIVR